MDKQQTTQTKDAALQQLGLTTKRARSRASPHLDFTTVGAGRRLLTQQTLMPAVIVGTTGSANVNQGGGHVVRLEAPFVIDYWAADGQRLAQFDIVACDTVGLLFVDWRRRESVFAHVPFLTQLSAQSQALVQPVPVIDLTTTATTTEDPQPVHI